ncbi:MAG: N-acetylglucosaminyldiphosphoundecaprenol N-acetyl-beta-D-mannosaminyltransferase [Bacteroidales bacterium]|nr:N-acetylglucosaminyldiphosphoundecaprenol N-acetyl-beta-D-mannosaminyltransferase [Bacteroidales bacterium]
MTYIKLRRTKILERLDGLAILLERKLLINTINAHSYNLARKDREFAEALLKGDVLIPDGASIVKAIKWLRGENIERIAGWDLFVWEMMRLEQRTKNKEQIEEKGKVFFLGSSDDVLAKIKERANMDYPHLEIYTYSPPYKSEFTKEENQAMIDAINVVKPDLLWIGMTAPKQEKWAYKHLDQLDVKGHMGTIGAVFDFFAGTVERAPLWWQEHSLEWFYRLIKEPRRMWRRYLIGNVKFVWYMIEEKFDNV